MTNDQCHLAGIIRPAVQVPPFQSTYLAVSACSSPVGAVDWSGMLTRLDTIKEDLVRREGFNEGQRQTVAPGAAAAAYAAFTGVAPVGGGPAPMLIG